MGEILAFLAFCTFDQNSVMKITWWAHGEISKIFCLDHFSSFLGRNAKISPIFHFDRGHQSWICHIQCVNGSSNHSLNWKFSSLVMIQTLVTIRTGLKSFEYFIFQGYGYYSTANKWLNMRIKWYCIVNNFLAFLVESTNFTDILLVTVNCSRDISPFMSAVNSCANIIQLHIMFGFWSALRLG